jgi:hypothetical protein
MTDSWQHWTILCDEQLKRATEVGAGRQKRAKLYGRKHANNLADDYYRDLHRHIMAAKSELAAKVFMGPWCVWDTRVYGKVIEGDPADLQDFIDVKGVERKHLRLIVPVPKLVPQFAYLLVYCDEPWFWIKGWLWGREMDCVKELQKNRSCYISEDDELHDPVALIKIAWERRNK